MSMIMELRFGQWHNNLQHIMSDIVFPYPFPKRVYHILDRRRIDANTVKNERLRLTNHIASVLD